MPTLKTLSLRKEFEFTVIKNNGFVLEYSGRPHVTAKFIDQIKKNLAGKVMPGGFSQSNPPEGSFGAWLRDNSKSPKLTGRHASHIAAILLDSGIIEKSEGIKPVTLFFAT